MGWGKCRAFDGGIDWVSDVWLLACRRVDALVALCLSVCVLLPATVCPLCREATGTAHGDHLDWMKSIQKPGSGAGVKGTGSPSRLPSVPDLIPVLGSQHADDDVRHKPGGRLSLLSASMQLPSQPLRGLLPVSLLGEQRHDGCEQFA